VDNSPAPPAIAVDAGGEKLEGDFAVGGGRRRANNARIPDVLIRARRGGSA
jgi:hypothetical protein